MAQPTTFSPFLTSATLSGQCSISKQQHFLPESTDISQLGLNNNSNNISQLGLNNNNISALYLNNNIFTKKQHFGTGSKQQQQHFATGSKQQQHFGNGSKQQHFGTGSKQQQHFHRKTTPFRNWVYTTTIFCDWV